MAGLIHDLGNPPFGHYGETVIRDWFGKWFSGEAMLSEEKNSLSEQQKMISYISMVMYKTLESLQSCKYKMIIRELISHTAHWQPL